MANWLLERRLIQNSGRLKTLHNDLLVLDEQLDVFVADADDLAIRSFVAETPGATFEANDAKRHADAIARGRQHLLDSIAELERRQNDLLDKLTQSR